MRWKGFITLSVLLAVFIVGTLLFSSTLAHRFIEKSGTAVWGAKVEAESVRLSFSPLGINIRGFTVASRTEEFKNMMEVESAEFSLYTAPILERKINIKEISGRGLAFGTERDTSGFIPRREKEAREDRTRRYRQQLSQWLSQIKERAVEEVQVPDIEPGELESFKQAQKAREKLNRLKEEADELKETDAENTTARLEKSIRELEKVDIKTEQDVAEAEVKVRNLTSAIEDAEEFIRQTRSSVSQFSGSASAVAGEVEEIDRARRSDYRSIMDKLQLPSIEVEDIAETVFGPLVVDRFMTLTGYLETVRKYIPPRTENKKATRPPRFKGEDVIFFREKMHPPFLVENALISGDGGQYIKLENFSSAPWLTASPALVSAAAGDFEINASFDRRRETPRDLVEIEYRNFRIDRAEGDLSSQAEFKGDEIDAEITWLGRGLLPQDWLQYIRLDDPEIEIKAAVTGSKESPSFEISSNLDRILSARLKEELDRQIALARQQVQKMVDQKVLARREELTEELKRLRDETVGEIQKEMDTVLAKKIEAEEEIEEKKNEMEEVLKEKASEAEEKIRDLFR